MNSPARGNALFLILIAVALFAALGYAITQSGRGGGDTKRENTELAVSRINNFFSALQAGVTRMRVLHNTRASGIYYNNDVHKNYDGTLKYGAMGSPADPSLYLFHAQGGGVTPMTFEDAAGSCGSCSGATKPGHFWLAWMNVPGHGTADADIVGAIAYVTLDMCTSANRKAGLSSNPSFAIGSNAQAVTVGSTAPTGMTAMPGAVSGLSHFCIANITTPPSYFYFTVLDAF